MSGCSSTFVNKDNYRAHVKTVHKDLSATQLEEIVKRIATMKPSFEVNVDEILYEDQEEPRKGKLKKKLS